MVVPGIAVAGSDLVDPRVAGIGFGVALLSSAIPYSFELEALRRLAIGTFGVLMSLEPAVAALVGLVALGQDLATVEVVGIGLVIAASAGALREPGAPAPREA
jgi:inner membrane transporter RhtA